MKVKGIAAAPGYAIGRVRVYRTQVLERCDTESAGPVDPRAETERLHAAVEASRGELMELTARVGKTVGPAEAAIFKSQLCYLSDPEIVGSAAKAIENGGLRAEEAIASSVAETVALFEEMGDDEFTKERGADVRDVGRRILANLGQRSEKLHDADSENNIIVAHDLSPSDTARLDPARILAFAVDLGGPTSHSAILAKAMGLAAVVGLKNLSSRVADGDAIIVDGFSGEVFIRPDFDRIAAYETKLALWSAERKRLASLAPREARTRSGRRIIVAANISSPSEIEVCLANGAEGIGLFRTEFLFMDRDTAPDEDEQFEAYKAVLEKMTPRPVIIRTLDIGGDKGVPYLGIAKEENPFLGFRAIRFCLKEVSLFSTQIRALIRASRFGQLKIMFPMIGSIDELRKAKAIVADCAAQLGPDAEKALEAIEVGIMIELPSAALVAEELAAECDFFSIGTNDLTQYTLAVDRLNESVASLYDARHPAVLRLIKMSVDAAHRQGIHCGMCGELAGDPEAIPLLIDYGLDELSMSAPSIPGAKEAIARR